MNSACAILTRFGIIFGVLLLAVTQFAAGQSDAQKPEPALLIADPGKKSLTTKIVYRPPPRGAPVQRVSGSTRGSEDGSVVVSVLAPEGLGLTIREYPTLYWFVSQSVDNRVVVSVIDESAIDLLLETSFASPKNPGIQSIRLADQGFRLEPGKRYVWEVALVDGSGDRLKDVYARGAIERVAPSSALRATLEASAPLDRARALAEAGIWYDAIEELSDAIEAAPNASSLRSQRRSLLTQVKLHEVAAYDR